MKKIQFYGEKDFVEEEYSQPEALPPEKKKFYKKFRILDVIAIALSLLLFSESLVLKALRIFCYDEMRLNVEFLFIETITVALGVGIFFIYRRIDHSLSVQNMAILIAMEVVLLVGQLLLYSFCLPILFWLLIAVSCAFIIYTINHLNCKVIFRFAICLVLLLVLGNANSAALRRFEFTAKYIYISNSGYDNKTIDNSSFYYSDSISKNYVGTSDGFDYLYSIQQPHNSVDELISMVNKASSIGFSIISTDELKNRNDMFADIMPFGDVINFENRYNDDFFKNNMLLISVIGLESKDDTVEVTDIQYSKVYSKMKINYYKSNQKPQIDDKACCIIVYEVPQDVGSTVLNTCFGFSTDNAEINYINK